MATVITKEILNYAAYSIAINSQYAIKWDYDFLVYTNIDKKRAPTWGKVKLVQEYMEKYDYIFVLDADAYIQNQNIPITRFITESDASLFICENGPNGGELLNLGSFIVKNTSTIHYILDKWYMLGTEMNKLWEPFWEQSVLNYLYENESEIAQKIKVFPHNIFNSWWLDYKNPNPNQFIIHVMATTSEIKREVISKYYLDNRENYFSNICLHE